MSTVKFRVQPLDVEIPPDNPFAHDRLQRRKLAEVLTSLAEGMEGSCVLALDAAWGAGKTTFLKMWEQSLRQQGFPVVAFNAWETDFTHHPFLALSTELTQALKEHCPSLTQERLKKLKDAGQEVLKVLVPLVAGRIAGQEVEILLNKVLTGDMDQYQEVRKAIREFKCQLRDIAGQLAERQPPRPLVILIDELDRCRPSYAVEFLEVAKHLFAVEHVVFVMAVNRRELVHTLQAFYGANFDAAGYLCRFIDLDVLLPEPDRSDLAKHLLAGHRWYDFLDKHQDGRQGYRLLQSFLCTPELSLRDMVQVARRLDVMIGIMIAMDDGYGRTILPTVLAIILRMVNPSLYHEFRVGQATDEAVADMVFGLQELSSLRFKEEGKALEILIFQIAQPQDHEAPQINDADSLLLQRYRKVRDEGSPPTHDISRQHKYVHAIGIIERMLPSPGDGDMGRMMFQNDIQNAQDNFQLAVERLELFSSVW